MRDIILILSWGLVILFFLPRTVWWIRQWLLHGALNEVYFRHIAPWRVNEAYDNADIKSAKVEMFNAKLAQLVARRYADRELAVKYFENVAPPNEKAEKRLIEALVTALPGQHQPSVQAQMACLLCKTLRPHREGGDELPRKDWSFALWIWLIEIALIATFWTNLTQLPMWCVLLVGLIVFVVTFLPLLRIVHDRYRVLQVALLTLGIISAGMWQFSEIAHTGSISKQQQLDLYGFGKIDLHVLYPAWLTIDDIDSCVNRTITASLDGDSSLTGKVVDISFGYDSAVLKPVNKKNNAITPSFVLTATNPIEFCFKPTGRNVLMNQKTTIVPQVPDVNQTGATRSISELAFDIQLEDPMWKIFRDICKYAGFSAPAAVAWYILEFLRKKQ